MSRTQQIIRMNANSVQVRVRIHPGIYEYFSERDEPFGTCFREFIETAFIKLINDEDIEKYIVPHEKQPPFTQKDGQKNGGKA